jgi:hypothetical protein
MGNVCCADIMLHSSESYHHEHALHTALGPRRLHKDELAASSAAIPRFHGVFSLGGVLICGRVRCVSQVVPPTRVRWCLSFVWFSLRNDVYEE